MLMVFYIDVKDMSSLRFDIFLTLGKINFTTCQEYVKSKALPLMLTLRLNIFVPEKPCDIRIFGVFSSVVCFQSPSARVSRARRQHRSAVPHYVWDGNRGAGGVAPARIWAHRSAA